MLWTSLCKKYLNSPGICRRDSNHVTKKVGSSSETSISHRAQQQDFTQRQMKGHKDQFMQQMRETTTCKRYHSSIWVFRLAEPFWIFKRSSNFLSRRSLISATVNKQSYRICNKATIPLSERERVREREIDGDNEDPFRSMVSGEKEAVNGFICLGIGNTDTYTRHLDDVIWLPRLNNSRWL